MFQGTKRKTAKEQEQMIARQQERLVNFERAMKKISGADDVAMDIWEELEKEQNSFDESLTHVVEYIKQIRSGEMDRSGQEEQLLEQLKELEQKQNASAVSYQKTFAAVREEEKQLLAIVEENKHFTEPARTINQGTKELWKNTEQMEETLTQMKEFGRQMGVLSLNAAIEAGRMGESGRKFVAASEEVRVFAGKYQEAADILISQIDDMKRQLTETREQAAHLTGLLKDNNVHMAKTSKTFGECVENLGQIEMQPQVHSCNEILKGLREAADVTKDHETYFEQTLQYMEQAGESFIREQEFMEQLKEQWKRVWLEVDKAH